MNGNSWTVAIVGATGAVGRDLIALLEERSIPLEELRVFASPASLGEEILFHNAPHIVSELSSGCFEGVDAVFGATPPEVARAWIPQAVNEGAVVIDCASAFAHETGVPLVLSELNPETLSLPLQRRIIALPDSVTVALALVLRPLQLEAGIKRVVVSSYQSTSGAGRKGMETLSREVLGLYQRGSLEPDDDAELEQPLDTSDRLFPHQIAFNAIPCIGAVLPDGYTHAEWRVMNECRKLLEAPELAMSMTCVRVPWFACDGFSINLETERPLSVDRARVLLEKAPGIALEDEPSRGEYPMPFPHAGSDRVYVGRIRRDPSVPSGLNLWAVADNVRRGAALTAVGVLECLNRGRS